MNRASYVSARRLFSQAHLSTKRVSPSNRVVSFTFGVGAIAGVSFYFFYPDASRSAPTLKEAPLSPSYFTLSTVESNEVCGPDTKLLQVSIPPNLLPPRDATGPTFAPIWSIYIKDDDIQVERPYTPLEGIDEDGRMLFWIKKYPKGEVSRWLHAKNPNDTIELRGPLTTYLWKEDTWDEVVMISGGTGITPFYQLFHSVISPQVNNKTRFTLLHSSRSPVDLPPSKIIDRLSVYATENPGKFQLQLFVDSHDGLPDPPHLPQLQVGRIGRQAIEKCLGVDKSYGSWWNKIIRTQEINKQLNRKVLFLVCGPDPMVNAISGPHGRNFSQGSVGGILGQMGYTASQVWKF